jgi:hypothetical protein
MTKEEMDKLLRRYRVDSVEALVEAQARHIKQLHEDIREMDRDAAEACREAASEARREAETGEPYGTY